MWDLGQADENFFQVFLLQARPDIFVDLRHFELRQLICRQEAAQVAALTVLLAPGLVPAAVGDVDMTFDEPDAR